VRVLCLWLWISTLELVARAQNVTRNVTLAEAVEIADTSRKRRTGLLKHSSLPPGQGLWLLPCEGVHTFGMKFPIDVVFLDRRRKILKTRPAMPRRRMSICLWAHSVLELPAGTLAATGTVVGDQLSLDKE
jgi:uncharacterized membrane protein (UPF0127 family)